MHPVRSHRELVVWQRAMELVTRIYRFCSELPASERFALTSQITRAAISIPANIAEGYGRGSTRDYARFLSIARGSASELETLLLVAVRIGYTDQATAAPLLAEIAEIGRMLSVLRSRVLGRPKGY